MWKPTIALVDGLEQPHKHVVADRAFVVHQRLASGRERDDIGVLHTVHARDGGHRLLLATATAVGDVRRHVGSEPLECCGLQ